MVMLCTYLVGGFESEANELPREQYIANGLPRIFKDEITYKEIEGEFNKYVNVYYPDVELNSIEYIEVLYKLLFGKDKIEDDITNEYFQTYASMYVYKYQKMQASASEKTINNMDVMQDAKEMTIEESRMQSIQEYKAIEKVAKTVSIPKATYSVQRAQEYAKRYALSWNYVFGRYDSDCTNFTSQIINYGGFPVVSGEWQWNGNEWAKQVWNVAQDFTEYWTLVRGYNGGMQSSLSSVQTVADPGDCMGYYNKNNYRIWHEVFVQSKSYGHLYISSHTTDRYNEKWLSTIPSDFINNNRVIVVDFT